MRPFVEDPIVKSKFKECAMKRTLNIISPDQPDHDGICFRIQIHDYASQ